MSALAVARPAGVGSSGARRRVLLMLLFVLVLVGLGTVLASPASAAPAPAVATTVPAAPTKAPAATPAAPSGPAGPAAPTGPAGVNINVGNTPSSSITLILAVTVLAVAPSVLLLCTSFTKIVVVLGLTRNALGLQTSPPNQVITGIALFLTMFVMGPVLSDINKEALQPYLNGQMSVSQAYDTGVVPLKKFMLHNTRSEELTLMVGLSGEKKPADKEHVTMTTLVPAFVLSELKSAFIIGLVIFIPFLVLDMLVSAGLMSMGMMMVPPAIVSLPFKLLLFVVIDGWAMITTALVGSYT